MILVVIRVLCIFFGIIVLIYLWVFVVNLIGLMIFGLLEVSWNGVFMRIFLVV